MEALRSCHDVPHHVQEAANSSDPTLESFFPSFLSLPFSSFLSLSLSLSLSLYSLEEFFPKWPATEELKIWWQGEDLVFRNPQMEWSGSVFPTLDSDKSSISPLSLSSSSTTAALLPLPLCLPLLPA